VAVSSAGDVVGLRLSCNHGDQVQVLQGADGEVLLAQRVAPRGGSLAAVSASPCTAAVACAGDDGRVLVLPDPFEGASAQVLHDTHGAVAFTAACWASEDVVAVAGCDGRVAILDRRAGRPTAGGFAFSGEASSPGPAVAGVVRRLRAAPGGTGLAAAHSSGLVTLWDLRTTHRAAAVCQPAKDAAPWGDVWDVRFTGQGGEGDWHVVFGTQSGLLGSFSREAPACKPLFQDSTAINSLDVRARVGEARRLGGSQLVGATDAECLLYMS